MSESLNDKLEAYFRARPMAWIDGKEIAQVAGYAGYRNRITDLRLIVGMDITNRRRREHNLDCATWLPQAPFGEPHDCDCKGYAVSEYRFDPETPAPVETQGHDCNAWGLR